MKQLWCDGQWLEARDFRVSPTDRGLLHGLGLFETLLAIDGKPVFFEGHLARLSGACERLGWQMETEGLDTIMEELLTVNQLGAGRARIRLAVSAGSGRLHDLTPGSDRMIWMTANPAADAPLTKSVDLSPWLRNERSPLAGLKCASYAENLVALEHSLRMGFEETIFMNTVGNVCEASTANLFVVREGAILTPSLQSGCLPGITRGVVIGLADQLRMECVEGDVTVADLDQADELFLTSSINGVTGIHQLGDRLLSPGPITRMLQEAWLAAARRDAWGTDRPEWFF
jgi:branched-chain amino acid aminotransferase